MTKKLGALLICSFVSAVWILTSLGGATNASDGLGPPTIDELRPERLTRASRVAVHGTGSVKIISQNVGSAQVRWSALFEWEPVCPGYKLCDPETQARVRENFARVRPDVILIQEATSRASLFEPLADGAPILPPGYEAACVPGGLGYEEVCVAWNQERARLEGRCRSTVGQDGGVLLCPLSVDGMTIHFVSAHPSAWNTRDREIVLREAWSKLIDRKVPTVFGGDFNTEKSTLGVDGTIPYPVEFGTLFGRHLRDFGRWTPSDSFFGNYELFDWGRLAVPRTTTVMMERLDHIFANFGEPAPLLPTDGVCRHPVCVGNVDEGYEWWGDGDWGWGARLGPMIDHRPIVARLSW